MNRQIVRQATNIIAVIATIVINGLANAIPFNGLTTAEISDRFQVYFVPAGYVFSIWGLIYLALIGFAVYQVLPGQRENPRLQSVGYLFALSSLANIVWLFLWHYELFPLTILAMLSLLILLITIYLRLGIGRTVVSLGEKWFVRVPFSIYLGWVTVATIANVTDLLEYLKWGGWGINPQIWALIMLIAGAAITLIVNLSRDDSAYVLVIIWAYVGIAIKQADTTVVAIPAWIIAAAFALLLTVKALQRIMSKPSSALAG
jgi:benzodiazapine receptor